MGTHKMLPIYFIIIATVCLMVEGQSIEGQRRNFAECEGSLRLVSPCGLAHKYQENTPHMRFNAAKAVLEGCGCYRLHEGRKYRGRSFDITARGRHVVTLRKVKSISKISCSSHVTTEQDRHTGSHIRKHCKKKRHKMHY